MQTIIIFILVILVLYLACKLSIKKQKLHYYSKRIIILDSIKILNEFKFKLQDLKHKYDMLSNKIQDININEQNKL